MALRALSVAAILAASCSLAQAADFGMLGMNIGMGAGQVKERLLETYPEARHEFKHWQLPDGSEWIANGRSQHADWSNPGDSVVDAFNFAFTGVGSGNKLFAINRELRFKQSQRPSTQSVYDAAVEKFGPPSYSTGSTQTIHAAWKFTAKDLPADELKSMLSCTRMPPSLSRMTVDHADFCGLYVEVTVQGNNTGLASTMSMTIINHLDAAEDLARDDAYAQERLEAAKKDNLENAAPVPQL